MNVFLRAVVLAFVVGLVLAAPARASDEELLSLAIAAGRWPILIERALEGIGVVLPVVSVAERDDQSSAAIWRTLREAAREGAILKELACAKKVVGPVRCRRFRIPEWVSEDAEPVPSLAILATREAELARILHPILEAACAVGVKRTKNPLVCSVE